MTRRPWHARGGFVVAALAVLIWGSVLAIGAVHLSVLLALGALGAAGLVGTVRERRLDGLSLTQVGLPLLATYSFAQAVPLPSSVLGGIAPPNADIWSRALGPSGAAAPSWMPISLDPGATAVEGLKWLLYSAVFACSIHVARRRGARLVLVMVFVTGVSAALVTVAHGLAGATWVYGLYRPKFLAAPWHVGPLLNPNNLAGYLNLSTFCGVGLLASVGAHPGQRLALAAGTALLVGVCVTTASRAGVALLPAGMLAVAVIAAATRRRRSTALKIAATATAGALAGGLALALLAATPAVWDELLAPGLEKLDVIRWTGPMIQRFAWLGAGRGAFGSTFPEFQRGASGVAFQHAESFPAQWATEWGLPVAALAAALFVWLMRPRRLGVASSSTAAAAWVGLLVVVAHNLVDLAFEVPGVMVGFFAVLGALWGARGQHRTPVAGETRVALAVSCAVPLALVGAVIGAAVFGWNDLATDRQRLHRLHARASETRSDTDRAHLKVELRRAILRHPADGYLPLLAGLAAHDERSPTALAWLARAIERAPLNGRAHLALAEVLRSRGAVKQSLLELRLAAEHEPGLTDSVSRRANAWARDVDERVSVAPPGPGGAAVLVALAGLEADSVARHGLLAEALGRAPRDRGANSGMASELLASLSSSKAPCAGDQRAICVSRVRLLARTLSATDAGNSMGVRVEAQLLLVEGDATGAEAMLEAACPRARDREDCLESRARVAAAVSDTALDRAARDYLGARCGADTEACAQAAMLVGRLSTKRETWANALAHFHLAVREAPTADRWLEVADAAEHLGIRSQVAEALERALRLRGTDPELERRLEAARRQAILRNP